MKKNNYRGKYNTNKNNKLQKFLIACLMSLLILTNVVVGCYAGEKADLERTFAPEQSIAMMYNHSLRNIGMSHGLRKASITSSDIITGFQTSCFEPPVILWNKTYGGNKSDNGKKIIKTSDNGYVILGSTSSFIALKTDFWLLKTDANGDELWNHTYGTEALDEYGVDVKQTSDGGYILVGNFFFFQSHDQGIRLVKTNANGVEQWNKTFGDFFNPATACSVYQTSDGGYLILGDNWTSSNNLYLIKTDSNGSKLWEMYIYYQAGYDSTSFESAKTNDGGFIITGITYNYDDIDMFFMKIDAMYNRKWYTTIGGNMIDAGLSIIETQDNCYVAAGVADAVDEFEGGDVFLVKVDNQGNEKWNRTIGGDDTEIGWSVKETKNGYVIVGNKGSYLYNNDLLLVHTDNQGIADKNWSLGGDSYDEGYCVLVTSEDDYIITGYTASYGTSASSDLWLLKIQGLKENYPPSAPIINGTTIGKPNIYYQWNFTSTDPNTDDIFYKIDWGDGDVSDWFGTYNSGETMPQSHKYDARGIFTIRAKAKDAEGAESEKWGYLEVTMPRSYNLPFLPIWEKLFERFQHAFPLIRNFLGY